MYQVHRVSLVGVTIKDLLTPDEFAYLRSLIGSDVVGRHSDFSPWKTAAVAVWEKVKNL